MASNGASTSRDSLVKSHEDALTSIQQTENVLAELKRALKESVHATLATNEHSGSEEKSKKVFFLFGFIDVSQIEELTLENDDLRKTNDDLRALNTHLKDDVADSQEQVKRLEKKVSDLTADLLDSEEATDVYVEKLKQMEKENAELKEGRLPSGGNSDESEVISKLKKENDNLLLDVQDLEAEVSKLKTTNEDLRCCVTELDSVEKKLAQTTTELESATREKDIARARLVTAEVALASREAEIQALVSDSRLLMAQLERCGIKVEVHEKGLRFVPVGKEEVPALTPREIPVLTPREVTPADSPAETPPPARKVSSPAGGIVANHVVPRESARPRRSSKAAAEAAAARGDMKTLLTLDVDDLLG